MFSALNYTWIKLILKLRQNQCAFCTTLTANFEIKLESEKEEWAGTFHRKLWSQRSATQIEESLPEIAWCTHKTTRKTYSLTIIFSILFKSLSELGATDFQKKLQQMHYARSCLSTVVHMNLWSFKYCGIKVFTFLDKNVC